MRKLKVDNRQSWKPQDMYIDAISWIAGNEDDFQECHSCGIASGLMSVMVVAEIFKVGSDEVASDVAKYLTEAK